MDTITAVVEGKLFGENAMGILNADVKFISNKNSLSAKTDSSGAFFFSHIPAGKYVWEINNNGVKCGLGGDSLQLGTGDISRLEIVMKIMNSLP